MLSTPTDVALVIYDLDGTLYEETRHFVYYAKLLRDALPEQQRDEYWNELELIWSNHHPLKIGRVYDAYRDVVLSVDEQMRVVRAWSWQGQELKRSDVALQYPDPVVCRMDGSLIAVGDGWWIPVVCARRQGLSNTRDYYVQTKQRLHETPEWLQPVPGLADAVRRAGKVVPQIVATNSDREDAEMLLQRLGLADAVNGLYPSCNKPADAEHWFRRICDDWGVSPRRCVSVGDNHLNDVMPALRLGMHGVLIDGGSDLHEVAAPAPRLQRIRTIRQLIPWLQSVSESPKNAT